MSRFAMGLTMNEAAKLLGVDTTTLYGMVKSECRNFCPPWWTGHWRDWHRGHECNLDPDANPKDPWWWRI